MHPTWPCPSRTRPGAAALATLSVLMALGCGAGERSERAAATHSSAGGTAAGLPPVTQAADPDPCSFLSPAAAEAIMGPLKQPPYRVNSDDGRKPDPEGRVCAYLPLDQGNRRDENVRVEVATHDGLKFQTAVGAVVQATGNWVPGHALGDTAVASPWDAAGRVANQLFTARQGDVAVQVTVRWMGLKDGRVDSIAARVLANIPDVPAAAPAERGGDEDPPALDPCRVFTRAEVEGVVGRLSDAPYRSRMGSSLADATGGSCSYRTPHHRVLVVTPTGEGGAAAFKLSGFVGKVVGRVIAQGQEADTLDDGPWDAAASGTDGTLLLLKGDALLELGYRTSSTNLAGAARLGALGLPRL